MSTAAAAAAAKSLQSCSTLCDPIDSSPPGSPVPGILQARMEWVAVSFSNAWKWKVKVKSLSCVRLFATPWTAPFRLLRPWDFPGKRTGVGRRCLLHFQSLPSYYSDTISSCYLFLNFIEIQLWHMNSSGSSCFHSALHLWVSFLMLVVEVVCSFSWLHSSPQYEFITSCLFPVLQSIYYKASMNLLVFYFAEHMYAF